MFTPPHKMSPRVLLVDDEPVTLKFAQYFLERAGYSVKTCENGVEALRQVESAEFDAIVTDVCMPQLDGVGLLRTLRSQGHNIPILFLTGYSDLSDDLVRYMGVNDLISKPIQPEVLLNRLELALRESSPVH